MFSACGEKPAPQPPEIYVKDLQGEVKVYQDNYGIYHIYGENDGDVALVQGFIEAKSRLFFMEFLRRAAEGDIAYFFGNAIKEINQIDKFLKAVQFDLKGGMIYDDLAKTISPQMVYLSKKFCEGINAYIRGIKEGKYPLPEGYKFYDIPPSAILRMRN